VCQSGQLGAFTSWEPANIPAGWPEMKKPARGGPGVWFVVVEVRRLLCGLAVPQILQRLNVVERPSRRCEDTIHLGGTDARTIGLVKLDHLNPRIKYFVCLPMQLFKLIDYLLNFGHVISSSKTVFGLKYVFEV
jgi:hypothetical protein